MASKAKVSKAVKVVLLDVFADKVVARRDGTFEAKRGYFYHNGKTAEDWAKQVESASKWLVATDWRDDYKAWPKDSYFVATVEVLDGDWVVKQAEKMAQDCEMTLDELYADLVAARG